MVFVVLPHHSYYRYFYPLTTVVMWLGTTKNRTFNAEKPPFGAVFLKKGGPSDRIRTCGILLPKQARYQLRYTRLLSYSIRLGVFSQSKRATNCATPRYYSFLLFARLPCSPGLRFPKKSSRCSPARFFRPRRVLRLAASATGGARLRTPKCRRCQLRSPPKLYYFLPACLARPACGPR